MGRIKCDTHHVQDDVDVRVVASRDDFAGHCVQDKAEEDRHPRRNNRPNELARDGATQ